MLREHGLTMTRSFFYWPDFMPAPDRIDETMAGRFADFLDRHLEAGLSTVPTFIVGHMSGENWDPSWRGGRDLYRDVWMVARQAWFAGEMVRRFCPHPAVAGWLVSNEMPIYGAADAGPQEVAAWAQIMRDAVRAAGGHQPFSLGDGAWGTRGPRHARGFDLADTARLCDFLGPHVYPVGNDEIRQHYAAAWECELAGTYGRPVVLEEFGVSSDHVSDAHAARYYRQTLHNSLLAGATGWIAWCNTDFERPGPVPPPRVEPAQAAASRDEGVRRDHQGRRPRSVRARPSAKRPWSSPPIWTPATRSRTQPSPLTCTRRYARPTSAPGSPICRWH